MKIYGLFATLLLGLFIIFGAFIMQLFKNKEKFLLTSLSMAFGVMMTLIVLELFPEAYEILSAGYNEYLAITVIVLLASFGFLILKVLDKFIPDHDKSDESNLMHIGIVSSIALTIHNIIEGMAVYSTVTTSLSLGLLLCIGVGLHNIPLGMAISSAFYKSTNNKRKSNLLIFFISLSTFIGGIVMFLTSNTSLTEVYTIAIVLSLTIGMLLYINLEEILPRMIKAENKKLVLFSVAFGMLLLIISTLFG